MAPASADVFSGAEAELVARMCGLPREAARDALLDLARIFQRAGADAKFAEAFRLAYLSKPNANLDLFADPRLAGWADKLGQSCATLERQGVRYAPVLAGLAVAAALKGDEAEVRRLVDYGRFFRHRHCSAPEGWTEADYYAALASEIKSDLAYYDRRSGRAIRGNWRRNDVMSADAPVLRAMQGLLKQEVERYLAELPSDLDHPFLRARPDSLHLTGWAVVSSPTGQLLPHIHGQAWLTCVYYVSRPPVSRDGATGWLRVGGPASFGVANGSGWEERMIEPAPGALVLMPSYFYHQTEPLGVDEERICIAFEMSHPELERDRDEEG